MRTLRPLNFQKTRIGPDCRWIDAIISGGSKSSENITKSNGLRFSHARTFSAIHGDLSIVPNRDVQLRAKTGAYTHAMVARRPQCDRDAFGN
jgi:hypothetical protein